MAQGFLVVDPTGFTEDQMIDLKGRVVRYQGWQHPDGVRWMLPVEQPTWVRDALVKDGWPLGAVEIAR